MHQTAYRWFREGTLRVPAVRVETEVGSGTNTELVEAGLSGHGRGLVVLDAGEVSDGLVRDMVEVLTSFVRPSVWAWLGR